ncbi:amidase family protein [Serinibacter arcticus]|uniref:amidase family protein n=1 Tax=Serinibacter arcticus TaxID=1655435 RepID=UPI0018EEAB8B|nr:amidase family protein [Serinibacter arcticus]
MPLSSSPSPATLRRRRLLTGAAAVAVALTGAVVPASALTYVTDARGIQWQVHDAAPPGLDTGSIRLASGSPIQGFGGIFVRVDGLDPADEPRLNGELARGFGLTQTGDLSFDTTQSVDLGGVLVTRDLDLDSAGTAARFVDSFTNTTDAPLTVQVSFGGSLGYGTGTNQSLVRATSSGDTTVDSSDAWAVMATTVANSRPVGVVLGAPGTLTGTGNQQRDPFETPLSTTGHEASFYGFVNELTIEPGTSSSLARFVHVGTQGAERLPAAEQSLAALSAAPDLAGLTIAQVCTLENWDVTALPGYDAAACDAVTTVNPPAAPGAPAPFTSVDYDVVGKTIEQLQADMTAGVVTSEQITQAYLDRIAVYDGGPQGFHSYLHVADDAVEQARAADAARAAGTSGELLGIPIALKDLYDTYDMPTTGGTRALEGFQPAQDAFQVAKLREAGAVVIGKANLSEFANSGGQSESGWMQTWNALYPSKTSFGSSGGSAVAVATSLATAAMGTQTGVSLYAPTTGASLTTFRGTDGMASGHGVIPLTWYQDYAGPIARTVTDLAYLLNATTGTDAGDPLTVEADARRPADWTTSLDAEALEGAVVGYIPTSFTSSYADDGTGESARERLDELVAAGATVVEMTAPPVVPGAPGGSRGMEGWARYIELHDNFPFVDGNAILASDKVLPYNRRNLGTTQRLTPEQVTAWDTYRKTYKTEIGAWMDAAGVDAVVYPGFLSDMYNNDAAASQLTSDRASGVLTSNVGLPTVVVPVGTNPHGYTTSLQLVGRAWDDAQVLGLGYALEQQTQAQQHTTFAPPLTYVRSFSDVAPDNQFFAEISWLAQRGISTGWDEGDGTYTFRPLAPIARDAMAAFLYRLVAPEGYTAPATSPFSDVNVGDQFYTEIAWLAESGVSTGWANGDGTFAFRPLEPIARDAMAAFLYRLADEPAHESPATSPFTDVTPQDQFYAEITWLAETGVATGWKGNDGTAIYQPLSSVARDAMAAFLSRFDELDR